MKYFKYIALFMALAMIMGCSSKNNSYDAVSTEPATVETVVEAPAVPENAPVEAAYDPMMAMPQGFDPSNMQIPQGFDPNNMQMPQGFDPNNMQMPQGFDPNNMQMPQGFDPNNMQMANGMMPANMQNGDFARGGIQGGGFNPGGMGFNIQASEPIAFTTDESSVLYEASITSVSSPNIPETYYDSKDILNIEAYEIVAILLKGDSFTSTTLPEGVAIKQDGEIIEIKNSTDKKYNFYLEGDYEGTIVIKSDDANYALTFNDVNLTGKSLPAMQLKSDTKAFFYSAEGSINRIADSSDNEKKGAITSSGDIIINGKGEIEITTYKKHGLKVDGTVRMVSGKLVVICDESSKGNAISADDAYIQDSGDVEIYAYGNTQGDESKGIKVNGREGENAKGHLVINGGTITIESVGKALTAGFKAAEDGETETLEDDPTPNVFINNGLIKINTTGTVYEISEELSLSPEGIEAKNNLVINGGLIEICATDDALNSGGSIIINSGCLFAYSMSADGMDANTSIEINGGLSVVLGSSAPEMAIDCDSNNKFAYKGGYVVALSGQGSQTPGNAATTGYVLSTGMQFANGESIAVVDSEGNTLVAFTVPENYTRASGGIIATSDFKSGETYRLLRNAEVGGEFFFNGAYLGNLTATGTEAASATISGSTTTIGTAMSGMGAMGGGFGGGFDPSTMMGPGGRSNTFQGPRN